MASTPPVPPVPPAGYTLDPPKPPDGYSLDDLTPPIQDTTDEGEPYWVSDAVGRSKAVAAPASKNITAAANAKEVAFVDPADHATSQVNVVTPELYTPSVAAHETTHEYQFSRNLDFQDNLRALDKDYDPSHPLAAYDYGGVFGLERHPKELGKLNREQQAKIVEDLATAQGNLRANMTPVDLAKWDETKAVLGLKIAQMKKIPPADQHSALTATDNWLQARGLTGRPLEHLRDILWLPKIDTSPLTKPEAPSKALGYAEPTDLVRGAEYVPGPQAKPPAGYKLDKKQPGK